MAQQKIVVGIDGSEGAKAALVWACEQAVREPGTKIVAVSSWMSPVPVSSPWVAAYELPLDLTELTAAELKESVASAVGDRFADVEVEERVVRGSAAAVLLSEGAGANMLVVGSRGLGGFKGLLLGSVSHQVVSHAPCPTVVVRQSQGQGIERAGLESIVVGVDGSPHSTAALRWAADRAQGSGAVVHAVYAWEPPPTAVAPIGTGLPEHFINEAAKALTGFIAAAELPSDVDVVPVSPHGSPAKALLTESEKADLLVVGARGHEGFMGLLLGSVASAVAHHAPCPVAVIPHQP